MDFDEIAQDISEQIDSDTVFTEYAIKEMLIMLCSQKKEYQSFSFLGVGGNGLVIKVNEKVAIKVVIIMNQDNLQSAITLEEEFKYMKQFSHSDYILRVYDSYYLVKKVKNIEKKAFFVMEMEICDSNLAQYLVDFRKNHKIMSTELAQKIALQALDSLNFLHQKGICHRDVKPQNFLVKKINGSHDDIVLKLADFGCATPSKIADKTSMKVTKEKSIRGTEGYMAFEVQQQMYFIQSDLYSMGLVLLQIENPLFDYSQVHNSDISDVQRQLNEHPFHQIAQIKRDTVLYSIARQYLKKIPKERGSAFFGIQKLLEIEKNKSIQLYSIEKCNLKKVLSTTKIKIGAFGAVVGAINKKKGNIQVALKIQKIQNDENKKQIEKEIETMMSLNSPYIVKVYNMQIIEVTTESSVKEFYYIIEMERCEMSLKSFLKQRKSDKILDNNQMKIDICIMLIDALNLLHQNDILHRDIKPENILVNFASDGRVTIKLADFGLSKKIPLDQFEISVMGTPIYLPEEDSKRNKYGKYSDAYSTGIVLIEIDNYKSFEYSFYKCIQLFQPFAIPFCDEKDLDRKSVIYQIASSILKYNYEEREQLSSCLKLLLPLNINSLVLISNLKKRVISETVQRLEELNTFLEKYKPNNDEELNLHLYFAYNKIKEEQIKDICNSLESLGNLTSLILNVSSCQFKKGIKDLSNSLARMQNLTGLDLELGYNLIGIEEIKHLSESVGKIKNLTYLGLSLGNNELKFKNVGIRYLCRTLEELTNLSSLKLSFSGSDFDNEDCKILGITLEKCPNLTTLNLESCINNNNNFEGIKLIWNSINANTNIINVSIEITSGYSDYQKLGNPIENNTRLKSLQIKRNSISNIGDSINGFSKSLELCKNLTDLYLELSLSQLGGYKFCVFAKSLERIQNLTNLYLGFYSTKVENKTAIECFLVLGGALENCINLTNLNIKCYRFSKEKEIENAEAIIEFSRSLPKCTKLTNLKLEIRDCNIMDHDIEDLAVSLMNCSNLAHLDLDLLENKFEADSLTGLCSKIDQSSSLSSLTLHCEEEKYSPECKEVFKRMKKKSIQCSY